MKSDLFHPVVSSWFERTYGVATPAQARAWPVIKQGKHTLIAAPTGSGKTLAAFMSAIDDLVREGVQNGLKDEVYVLYVSPLKALSNDIHKNLEEPLTGITQILSESQSRHAREGGYPLPPLGEGRMGGSFYLENIDIEISEMEFKTGKRTRKDGRIRAIFENATESNMLYRSLVKAMDINGKVISANIDKADEELIKNFNNITVEDKEAGYIYVLTSKSTNEKIRSIPHLYKIGYSTTDVGDRIKNAVNDPTYLMAPVSVQAIYQCFNMNPQKFELLLHNFFGHACLNIDIFDSKKVRHSPREWFIAPMGIIDQAIALVINGKIVNYKYDGENQAIVKR